MKIKTIQRRLAEQIAEELFTSAYKKQKAVRLKLVLPEDRDGGGWCREAVIKIIEEHLQ